MKIKVWLVSLFTCLTIANQAKEPSNYKLIFNEEFDGNTLNLNKWNVETGPRNNAINCPESIIVKNGNLIIHSFTKNNLYYTGIINTRNKFCFNQGYLEVRAAFDNVPGSWSDAWLYNDNIGKDEINPLKNGVEIDLFETRLVDYNNNFIGDRCNFASHYNGYAQFHEGDFYLTPPINLNDKKFHIFGLLWEKSNYSFFVDGKLLCKFDKPITNANLFLVLSTELANHQYPWTYNLPKQIDNNTLTVDYVRVYKKK